MEKLLRSCYDEAGILGANALIYEKRKDAIMTLIDDEILSRKNYADLTDWLMGKEERPEEVLIQLEQVFCKYDEHFTLQGMQFENAENKEVKILSMVLLYQYCVKNEDFEFPLKILCGAMVGYRIQSRMMEKKFDIMVSKYRISLRVGKELSKLKKMSAFTEAKKGITEAINNEIPYEAGASELKNVLEQIELCQRNIKILAENETTYRNNMKARSEETNLLWWLVSEWSEYYQKGYENMKVEEAALSAPFEINKLVEFDVYPYVFSQIIRKMLSVSAGDMETECSLKEMILSAGSKLPENSVGDVEKEKLDARIQPVLYGVESRNRIEKEEEWAAAFRAESGNDIDNIRMSVVDFSLQLCRELELLRYMQNER